MGGAVVHLPSASRTAQMISMVPGPLRHTRGRERGFDASRADLCRNVRRARGPADRVVPYLQAEIDRQDEQFDDTCVRYVRNARRFHEALVSRCGNEPMILLIGSLDLIWSAHESSVWADESDPLQHKTMRAALRDHHRLLAAIRDGNVDRAVRLARDHLAAARRHTLAFGRDKTIEAKLISRSMP